MPVVSISHLWHRLSHHGQHHHHEQRCSPITQDCPSTCAEQHSFGIAAVPTEKLEQKPARRSSFSKSVKHHHHISLREWEEKLMHKEKSSPDVYTLTEERVAMLPAGSIERFHFDAVKNAVFKNVAKKDKFRIDEIEYVVNPKLSRAFDAVKQSRNSGTVLAFHGTHPSNLKSICRENFKLSRCKSNTPDGVDGAIWFSKDPLQSMLYVPGPLCGDGLHPMTKKLMLAEILPGNCYEGLFSHACAESKEQDAAMYDTVADGHVVVVLDSLLVIPRYIVTITELP